MAESGIDPFEELRRRLERPVKLSETEKKKIGEIFTDLGKLLDNAKIEVLEMEQPAAYRYMGILLKKFAEIRPEFEDKPAARESIKPGKRPNFREIYDQLDEHSKEIAKTLDCVGAALELETEGHDASELLCQECSLESMLKCIRPVDPDASKDQEFHIVRDDVRGVAQRRAAARGSGAPSGQQPS